MNVARSAAEVLSQHTTLALECVDRMYLNVYVPLLQDGRRSGALLPRDARRGVAVVGADGADHGAVRPQARVLGPVLSATLDGDSTTRIGKAVALFDQEVDRAWHGQSLAA